MDNASDYGSEDSRFDSWQPRKPTFLLQRRQSEHVMAKGRFLLDKKSKCLMYVVRELFIKRKEASVVQW